MPVRRATPRIAFVTAALVLGALGAPAAAEELGPGDVLPALALPDPHGETHVVEGDTRVLILSRDMDGGGAVRGALEEGGAEFLAAHDAVYVADVSGMPWLIRKTIALPRMRDRPYPLLLDEDGEDTATLPHEEGKATLLFLAAGDNRVEAVAYAGTAEELRAAIEARAEVVSSPDAAAEDGD